jgi:hypothetical protein
MIRISKKTRLGREEIFKNASEYFGKNGTRLTETRKNHCNISFEGTGGYLSVTVNEEEGFRTVDVESREFEYWAKRFLEKIS